MNFHHNRMVSAIAGIACLSLVLAGCGSSDPFSATDDSAKKQSQNGTVVIGSADFAESEIIANIYAGALKHAGIDAEVKARIGSREVYMKALEDGSIDMMPEYAGNLLQYLDKNATSSEENEVYENLRKALPSNLKLLDKAEAQDSDGFYITKKTAKDKGIVSIGDLDKLGGQLTVTAPPEFAKRPYGTTGLHDIYGLDVTLLPMSDGGGQSTVNTLLDGKAQFIRLDSTSPMIESNDLTQLKDDKHMIPAQNVVPVIAASKNTDAIVRAVNEVQAKLTTQVLMTLNAQSANDKRSAGAIAQDWLAGEGLD